MDTRLSDLSIMSMEKSESKSQEIDVIIKIYTIADAHENRK